LTKSRFVELHRSIHVSRTPTSGDEGYEASSIQAVEYGDLQRTLNDLFAPICFVAGSTILSIDDDKLRFGSKAWSKFGAAMVFTRGRAAAPWQHSLARLPDSVNGCDASGAPLCARQKVFLCPHQSALSGISVRIRSYASTTGALNARWATSTLNSDVALSHSSGTGRVALVLEHCRIPPSCTATTTSPGTMIMHPVAAQLVLHRSLQLLLGRHRGFINVSVCMCIS